MFGRKKHREVEALVQKHIELVGDSVEELRTMMEEYLAGDSQFKELSRHIHELESQADKIRFEVEHLMYKGAFLPAAREDYIDLLEKLDLVANKAEEAADFIALVRPGFPEDVYPEVREIMDLTLQAFEQTRPLVKRVLSGDYTVREEVKEIGRLESKIDRVEFAAIRKTFKREDIERMDKLVVMMSFERLTAISDRIENLADHLSLIAIKRKLA